jgi:hypothetical protein
MAIVYTFSDNCFLQKVFYNLNIVEDDTEFFFIARRYISSLCLNFFHLLARKPHLETSITVSTAH